MRKALKILKLLSINGLVFLVLIESMSVAVYFFKTGELFYKRDRGRTSATRAQFEAPLSIGAQNPV
jgi:hypothetical protein